MGDTEARLAQAGITVPAPPAAVANYAPFIRVADQLWISGQISMDEAGVVTGKVGADLDMDEGRAAARSCAIKLLAQAKAACAGDLDRVARVVKLTGFVSVAPGFTAIPGVIDAASEVMVIAFGDTGRHARSAVGVAELPLGAAVEIDAVLALTTAGG